MMRERGYICDERCCAMGGGMLCCVMGGAMLCCAMGGVMLCCAMGGVMLYTIPRMVSDRDGEE